MEFLTRGIVDCEITIEFYLLNTGDKAKVFIFGWIVPWEKCEEKNTRLGKYILNVSDKWQRILFGCLFWVFFNFFLFNLLLLSLNEKNWCHFWERNQ